MTRSLAALTSSLACAALGASAALAQPAMSATVPAAVPTGSTIAQLAPRPGDLIRLRIWREPEMSGDYPVNDVGEVTLPRVPGLRVTGISADSLRRYLLATYTPFLRDASVDVFVLRRVRVVGEVRNPGLYPVDATMTVGDVIAVAGGLTPDADRRTFRLVRGGTSHTVALTRETRIAESAVQSGDQIEVPQRSWAARNPGIVAAIISSAGVLAITLIRR